MNQYGQIAIQAARYATRDYSPRQAWEKASCEAFSKGSASQVKGCPRTTFLALYDQTLKSPNAQHARDARDYLLSHPQSDISPKTLWDIVLKGKQKTYNSQMDVVLALYHSDLMPE